MTRNFFFWCIESTIWRPESDPIKRAAKTIISYIAVTIVERGEIQRKGRTYFLAGAPNDVTHIPSISLRYFPKDVVAWLKWTRFDRCYQ